MTQQKELYESRGVWDQDLQLGQKNLLQAIIDFMPNDVATVLDVGCGDGKITAQLIAATEKKVVGLDSSQEALSRCNFPTVVGDATAIAYGDRQFDLVMTTDMLEHLPASIEEKSWSELFRVAAHYVMVAVPFREELLDGTTRCPDCACTYHVNWHMRSYDWPQLLARKPPDWCADSVVLTGERWSSYHPIETRFRRHVLAEFAGWSEASCPLCGREGTLPDQVAPLSTETAKWLGRMIYQDLSSHGAHRSHTEILVVFRRQNHAKCVDSTTLRIAAEESRSAAFAESLASPSEAYLSPLPAQARIVRTTDGRMAAQFPVYEKPTGLTIHWLSQTTCTFQLDIEDGEGSLYSGMITAKAGRSLTLSFARAVVPGYYGLLVRMPNLEADFSLELDGGLSGLLLTGGSPSAPAYHEIALGGARGFVQITSPTWLKPSWLRLSAQGAQPEPWIGFLNERLQVAQSELASRSPERAPLEQPPEGGWRRSVRRGIASLQRAINSATK